ncbi:NAD-dependent epimerase/dehydratase family protein [Paenibacillus tritici]|uniref:NAD-dependent epimerase/dehydratase family protein n=1 Tax=Paenibacillus tritici TaxID=1873425 RepID=UPI001BA6D7F3|nr:NAD-dependent epimerase/dehydratase family protein [Paenibacillus tritici]QUL53906.1 NAD-dependent epimerase/dehydratase family protein [Paenibacillus tritici]
MEKKRILITGKGSYVGTSFMSWVKQWPEQYDVEELSVRGEAWKEHDFSVYDVVLHVAGIAHMKESARNAELYNVVNCDLTISIAEKAKKQGVKQFVFLSSMSVYGIEDGIITSDSIPKPKSYYGISKYQAEEGLKKLETADFKIAIVRPPMVYGADCTGNYTKLAKLAVKLPTFPNFDNKRSMIYIDNLSEFIFYLVKVNASGIFLPQNAEYVSTSEMVRLIAEANRKKVKLTKFFNLFIKIFKNKIKTINKMFGNLIYEPIDIFEYSIKDFKKTIYLTERGK